jgi:hypothetical protein
LKHFVFLLVIFIACSLSAPAQVLTGTVTNGTRNKPSAGDDVILLSLTKGMEEQGKTKTNAKGEFSFNMARTPNAMYLVRVHHQDVNYHEPVTPGTNNVKVTVYDSKITVPEIKLLDQSEIYQAKDNSAEVIELFRLSNTSNPPMTQPTFEFYLPEGASIQAGQAVANGTPIKSSPVPLLEKNKYYFPYPVRPGETHFEVVYTLPYKGSLKAEPKMGMVPGKFYVVTPKSIRFVPGSGSVFSSTTWPIDTSIKDIETHVADNPQAGTQLEFEISGTGLLPQDKSADQEPAAGGDNRPGGGLGTPNEKPGPLQSAQWLLLGILVVALAAGAFYVYSSNRPAAAFATGPAKPTDRNTALLEAMKEEIFDLEMDRLQGKLSPQEYEAAKSALDKTLQRAMQRQSRQK